jgi:hypothetical protein
VVQYRSPIYFFDDPIRERLRQTRLHDITYVEILS